KSITIFPASRSAGAISIASPCGSARKQTSASTSLKSELDSKITPSSAQGCTSLTSTPAVLCANALSSVTYECCARRRTSSPPAYPDAPKTAARNCFTSNETHYYAEGCINMQFIL